MQQVLLTLHRNPSRSAKLMEETDSLGESLDERETEMVQWLESFQHGHMHQLFIAFAWDKKTPKSPKTTWQF